jgi:hypothetical protein
MGVIFESFLMSHVFFKSFMYKITKRVEIENLCKFQKKNLKNKWENFCEEIFKSYKLFHNKIKPNLEIFHPLLKLIKMKFIKTKKPKIVFC